MILNFEINNKKYTINKRYNIIQICEFFNINIPKFCYHEKLSIAGNCRMCLVEVKGSIKPIASCALPISNNMVIFTNSKLVKKAREGILEFILLNHPLDCPICDQGGECDLQDQTIVYGNDKGRFYEYKKTALDKNCGFLIKTVMTRCIQCTRCVRFSKEIAGFNNLGLINRGYFMEISTFLNKIFDSEISGNIIDLCPVGALTSNPYSFLARSWELKNFNTIDLNDNLLSNIRVDVRNTEILRIIPRLNKNLNDFWILDITRFCFDGFKNNRILHPFLKKDNIMLNISWFNVIYYFKKNIGKQFHFILGNFLDIESLFFIKKFSNKYGNYSINFTGINKNFNLNNDFRKNYLFNINLEDLNNFKNYLLIGLNLRIENPILNIFLKNLENKNLIKVYNIGSCFNYNYVNYNFGNSFSEFKNILEGKSFFNNILINQNNNLMIIGQNFLSKKEFFSNIDVLNFFIKKSKVLIKVLNNNNTENASNDINLFLNLNKFNDITFNSNFKNLIKNTNNNIFYLINNDSILLNFMRLNFIVYQGHHNFKINSLIEKNFKNNLLILPTPTFFEKSGIFINFLGVYQKTKLITLSSINVRNDWKIINILYNLYFKKNLYNNIKNLRFDIFQNYNIFLNNFKYKIIEKNIMVIKNFKLYILKLNNVFMLSYITNLNMLNQIVKASKNLNLHSNSLRKKYTNFI